MTVDDFKKAYQESEKIQAIASLLQEEGQKIQLRGLLGSSAGVIADAVMKNQPGNHLFILGDKEEAAFFLNDLENLNKTASNILFFPHSYKRPYQLESTDNASVVARAEVLERINRGNTSVVVTYPEALFEMIVTKKQFAEKILEIKKGVEYSVDFINELLIEYEFEKVDFVYEPGQFAVRGGIIDIFSFSNDMPYRVEFFGDEVDSIRTFNPVNQLSVKNMSRLTVVPNIQKQSPKEVREDLLTFLPEQTNVWVEDIMLIGEELDKAYEKALKIYNELPESPVERTPPVDLFLSKNTFNKRLHERTVVEFGERPFYEEHSFHFNMALQPSFNKNFELLIANLKENEKAGFTNMIVSSQAKQVERLYSIFEDLKTSIQFVTLSFALHEGFIDNEQKFACYTDHQIFERYHRFRLKDGFKKNQQALTLKEIYNLQKGDYVTHIDHGIGKFSGLEIIDVNGKPQEAIRLIYKDNDVLYVSIHSLHRIAKYTGKEGTQPKMNKIGTQAWSKKKQKTKSRIKEIAYDLIKLYAKRKQAVGFAFSPDTYLQNELEASFIYEDTPDQLKATVAVKKDMESENPMDRLVCGDVGFGKTEVAIRAAFKAVADNKQVAILVPTTILALQHYKTFKERLGNMPCKVDYINRFRSAGQVKETLKELEEGKVDIIIGTHKLVGKGVKFKDLGLIIIDEEQKFGVGVKDKLKLFKTSVDTLTLTATPIPRTLQFSLMGARDLSVINTPPPNRQPVETEVITFNEERIRDAITYETQRGGQVFFVHNRVQNIHEVGGMIQRLCPGIRVAIGHGQMDGKKLEQLMAGFVDHEYDVLVATTIIESGIDVSNANTIIINHAQNFGLSDLHQMRGRVGRSNKKAFAYLIAPPFHTLPSDSRKRLEAVAHFTELGSGFNIAMRDLDIRGAGDLLGGEQSGFISDIGLDMYQKILNEAIQELKQDEFKDLYPDDPEGDANQYITDCILETDLELLIPDTYINNVTERLVIYQSLDNTETEEDLRRFEANLEDRFGPLPKVVRELIQSIELRWLARSIGFEKLVIKSKKMIGYFVYRQDSTYYQSDQFTKVLQYIQSNPPGVKMNERNNKLRLIVNEVKTVSEAIDALSPLRID